MRNEVRRTNGVRANPRNFWVDHFFWLPELSAGQGKNFNWDYCSNFGWLLNLNDKKLNRAIALFGHAPR